MSRKIISEIGPVHDGGFGNAKCLTDAAAECGVDAVKFQTHIAKAETLIVNTINHQLSWWSKLCCAGQWVLGFDLTPAPLRHCSGSLSSQRTTF